MFPGVRCIFRITYYVIFRSGAYPLPQTTICLVDLANTFIITVSRTNYITLKWTLRLFKNIRFKSALDWFATGC